MYAPKPPQIDKASYTLVELVLVLVILSIVTTIGFSLMRGLQSSSVIAILRNNIDEANRVAQKCFLIKGQAYTQTAFGTDIDSFCKALGKRIKIDELTPPPSGSMELGILPGCDLTKITSWKQLKQYLFTDHVDLLTEKGTTVTLSINTTNAAGIPQIEATLPK